MNAIISAPHLIIRSDHNAVRVEEVRNRFVPSAQGIPDSKRRRTCSGFRAAEKKRSPQRFSRFYRNRALFYDDFRFSNRQKPHLARYRFHIGYRSASPVSDCGVPTVMKICTSDSSTAGPDTEVEKPQSPAPMANKEFGKILFVYRRLTALKGLQFLLRRCPRKSLRGQFPRSTRQIPIRTYPEPMTAIRIMFIPPE